MPIAETLRAQVTLRERERRFRELLDALPAAVYTTDAAGRITYYNEAAVALWGHRPMLGSSEWCGSWKLYWPDGTPMPHDQCPMAVALKEDRAVRGLEAACERPDGTRVPFIPYPTPLHDEAGHLVGAVNMLVDISERKRTEEQQALLVRELHHRVKNTLATVQAIMGSTARSATSIEDFKNALIGRIGSLAKTHVLLTDEGHTTTFADILHSELDAFDDGSGERIRLERAAHRRAVAAGDVARHGDPRAHHQCREIRRALGLRRQSRRHLDCCHRGHAPHAEYRLGGKWRPAGHGADAAGLRLAAVGIRAARADPGQDRESNTGRTACACIARCRCRRRRQA